ncbi:MAG: hypothetical protein Kow0042_02310 [Calditrichia bacterium]
MNLPFHKIDDFELNTVIQDGPYSLSVLGYQPALKRNVFIKLLKPHIAHHRQWVERFTREAQLCARLKHPHIVDVYTIGEVEGYNYIAMEYVAGISLKELLEKENKLDPVVSLEIIRQLLLALEYTHKNGVVHRDIKPGNILLDSEGRVRLTDFGLAHLGEDASLTQQGSILGTPAYMSPEQITGEKVTPASDFFAVGATLYEMVTGNKPFEGENYSACIQKILNEDPPPVSEFRKEVPEEMESLIVQLIDKRPESRPHSASEIISRIESFRIFQEKKNLKAELAHLIEKQHRESTPLFDSVRLREESIPHSNRIQKRNIMLIGSLLVVILSVFLFWANKKDWLLSPLLVSERRGSKIIADSLKTGLSATATDLREKENEDKSQTGLEDKSADILKAVERPVIPPEESAPESQPLFPPQPEEGGKNLDLPAARATIPPKSTLKIQVKPWAAISLNGEIMDSLAQSKILTVEPGKYQLVFTHPNFTPKVFDLNVQPDTLIEITYSFLENAGYLSVDARPWANVFIDGEFVDTTPIKQMLVVSVGEHLVEFRHPEYPPYRQVIRVEPGDTITIKKNLIP